jgi:two-component system nitrogen regulation response regulator GlnG
MCVSWQSVLKQAVLQMRGTVLLADFLPIPAEGESFIEPSEFFDWDAFVRQRLEAGTRERYAEALERMEREILIRVLRHTAGNQVQAAQVSPGITRGSLRNKIRTLGIRLGRSVGAEEGDQG